MNQALSDIEKKIKLCQKCRLYKNALNSVPGESGNFYPQIMFIGEAPGKKEDETGRPFIGRAGKLLDELLKLIKIDRRKIFITSIIKHRPPKNRQPKRDEIASCSYWLKQQISVIKPKLIVTLGRFGLEFFLPDKKISQVHGTIIEDTANKNPAIFPVYHPAAGLRSTKNKKKLFEDFIKLKKYLGHTAE